MVTPQIVVLGFFALVLGTWISVGLVAEGMWSLAVGCGLYVCGAVAHAVWLAMHGQGKGGTEIVSWALAGVVLLSLFAGRMGAWP